MMTAQPEGGEEGPPAAGPPSPRWTALAFAMGVHPAGSASPRRHTSFVPPPSPRKDSLAFFAVGGGHPGTIPASPRRDSHAPPASPRWSVIASALGVAPATPGGPPSPTRRDAFHSEGPASPRWNALLTSVGVGGGSRANPESPRRAARGHSQSGAIDPVEQQLRLEAEITAGSTVRGSDSETRHAAALAKEQKRLAELHNAILTHPSKRTHAQALKIHGLISVMPGPDQLPPLSLNHLSHCVQGVKYGNMEEVYNVGDGSDAYYIIVTGVVTLYDSKEKDDTETVGDPMVRRLGIYEGFGDEELISGGRRAYTAMSTAKDTTLLRIKHDDYKRTLEVSHRVLFDAKVEFLSTLSPFRAIAQELVRRLAPAFHEVLFKKGECLVRQGDRADCMFAIMAGNVVVYVDPHHKEGSGIAELDPKKMMQVCMLDAGNIIGDMTVLANVKTRTASVVAATDVVTYRVRRGLFMRRVPQEMLEKMRRIAMDKLLMTTKQVERVPVVQSLKDKILQGHNLRELLSPGGEELRPVDQDFRRDPEDYNQLVCMLRKFKHAEESTSATPQAWDLSPPATYRAQPISSVVPVVDENEATHPSIRNPAEEEDDSLDKATPRPMTNVAVVRGTLGAPLSRRPVTTTTTIAPAPPPPTPPPPPSWGVLPSPTAHLRAPLPAPPPALAQALALGLHGSVLRADLTSPRLAGFKAIPPSRTAATNGKRSSAYSSTTVDWWTATFAGPGGGSGRASSTPSPVWDGGGAGGGGGRQRPGSGPSDGSPMPPLRSLHHPPGWGEPALSASASQQLSYAGSGGGPAAEREASRTSEASSSGVNDGGGGGGGGGAWTEAGMMSGTGAGYGGGGSGSGATSGSGAGAPRFLPPRLPLELLTRNVSPVSGSGAGVAPAVSYAAEAHLKPPTPRSVGWGEHLAENSSTSLRSAPSGTSFVSAGGTATSRMGGGGGTGGTGGAVSPGRGDAPAGAAVFAASWSPASTLPLFTVQQAQQNAKEAQLAHQHQLQQAHQADRHKAQMKALKKEQLEARQQLRDQQPPTPSKAVDNLGQLFRDGPARPGRSSFGGGWTSPSPRDRRPAEGGTDSPRADDPRTRQAASHHYRLVLGF